MRALALGCVMAMCSSVATISWADDQKDKVVRIAKLVIDPNQLAAYHAAVKEEMADSVRLEPGVLAIYSVAEKEHPNRIHFFEIYASDAAYRSHIASPHFQKYVKTTQPMILSRELLETEPVQLNSKKP
jgi:quinol monooxygenase YgiN